MALCGIFYVKNDMSHGLDHDPRRLGFTVEENLPLVSTSLHTTIRATTLHTRLTQTFDNPSEANIPSCKYQFPLYDGISIVKFTCTIGSRKLSGVVHEKVAARKIYDDAKNRGQTAGLLEQNDNASDVFKTSLGNIPAGEKVVVEIEYIGELKMEGGNVVKLIIPTKVAPRYGWSGPSSTDPSIAPNGGMKITVDVLMWESMCIDGLTSPSHPIAITIGDLSSGTGKKESNKASATLAQGSAALKQDFVLLVNVKDLGTPKAMLETHGTISNHRALSVSLVPKFTLPAHCPEIVFVVDRSGSMEDNMVMVISAMKVFLISLPLGTYFNICSFGTRFEFLWPKSKQYTPDSLEEALQEIETFEADFGGTQTLNALTATIQNRLGNFPLEIMLLTDGDIWQQAKCFEYLNGEVKNSQGAIRVFPLGIGDGVSHALINGIARAGNGFPQTVQHGENMERSVVRMLRGALYPHITDYTMEIKYESEDDDFEIIERVTDGIKLLLSDVGEKVEEQTQQKLPTISLFDPTVEDLGDTIMEDANPPQLPDIPTPKLLQAPFNIPSLFPGVNTVVYLLMSPETIQRNPVTVVLRGKSAHGPVELSIPIEILPVPANTIHQLAARKATQDLEEGRGWIHNAKENNGGYLKDRFPSQFADIVKREAVRLGQQFQIANLWCSFVAVAENDGEGTENEEFQESDFVDIENGDSRYQFCRHIGNQQQPRRFQSKATAMTRPADDFKSQIHLRHQAIPPPILMPRNRLSSSSTSSFTVAPGNSRPLYRRSSPQQSDEVSMSTNYSAKQATSMAKPRDVPRDVPPGLGLQEGLISSPNFMMDNPMRDNFMPIPDNQAIYESVTSNSRSAAKRRRVSQASATPIALFNSSPGFAIKKDWATASSVEMVLKIIELQQFDGTWVSLPYLEPVLRFKIPQDVFNVEKDTTAKKLWITLIVLSFLEHTMAREAEISELVVAKAKTWLKSTEAISVKGIEEMKKAAMEVVRKANITIG
ncbi:hypothetical protein NHQ30_011242 [Ciborinia camelliae]|nr:hypothetical protein NHQ30_011242 [Ciborinia camelliae]